jgi:hypothetical protein
VLYTEDTLQAVGAKGETVKDSISDKIM